MNWLRFRGGNAVEEEEKCWGKWVWSWIWSEAWNSTRVSQQTELEFHYKLELRYKPKLNQAQTRLWAQIQLELGSNSSSTTNPNWTDLIFNTDYKLNSNSDYKPILNWPQTRTWPQIELEPATPTSTLGTLTSNLSSTTNWNWTDLFFNADYNLNLNWPQTRILLQIELEPTAFFVCSDYNLKLKPMLYPTFTTNWNWTDLFFNSDYKPNPNSTQPRLWA